MKNVIRRMFAMKNRHNSDIQRKKQLWIMNWCFFLFVWCVFEMIKRRLMPVTHRNNWSFRSRWMNWKQMKIASQKKKIDDQTVVATANELKFQLNNIYEWPAVGRWRRRKKIMRARKEKKNFLICFSFFSQSSWIEKWKYTFCLKNWCRLESS